MTTMAERTFRDGVPHDNPIPEVVSNRQWEIFQLHVNDHMSYPELSARFNIAHSTVSQHVANAAYRYKENLPALSDRQKRQTNAEYAHWMNYAEESWRMYEMRMKGKSLRDIAGFTPYSPEHVRQRIEAVSRALRQRKD